MNDKKVILIIMDGWGLGQINKSDAIKHAATPFVTGLYNTVPNSTLVTCGNQVGLPDGQMGNSEVGHLNLGAGRIVYQDLERINVAIKDGSFFQNKALNETIDYAKSNHKKLHLLGLVSDGGVHAHINHLKAITKLCAEKGFTEVYIHAFTDGRDTDPKSGLGFIKELEEALTKTTGSIASITGRYYAMDRDKRWERVQIAYEALVRSEGKLVTNFDNAIQEEYDNDITDEFIKPLINANLTNAKIENGDAVIAFNFRTDRCREITDVLTQHDMPLHNMQKLDLKYCTMSRYDHTYENVDVMYEKDDLKNTLGEVLSAAGKSQVRIAETEKYPHVSFFFSGGRETPFDQEKRLMVPSPKVATYDLQPSMSANTVTETIVSEIATYAPDFICLNFANADMVGHTGVWPAIIEAVEVVDKCVEEVVAAALEKDYAILLTADHGNADYAVNEDGSPNTAHTLNLVPLFFIDKNLKKSLKSGKLGDIAPTILHLMDIKVPAEMTGDNLLL